MFVDPQLSVQLTPDNVQDISGSSGVYATHHYKGFLDQSFHGNGLMVYKPGQEPNGAYAATTSQSLSLSLSSHASNLPLELNLQRYDSSMFRNNKVIGGYLGSGNLCSSSSPLSRNPLPLGPFTGYSSVLKGSKFLKPTQQLLEEICDVGRVILADKIEADSSLMETLVGNEVDDDSLNCIDGSGQTRKKSRLLSLLNEVYKKYKQYYQQMQAVFTSFESVAGISSAAPFASMAIKAMSKHFRCLKNSITEQLQFSHGKLVYERDETRRQDNLGTSAYVQTPFLGPELVDQPVWRPQRGLPERAVIVLRAWLFDHFLHPYPTDTDKLILAKQTGLSRNQVSNWFINARVRLWKPMVEEIHTLETRKLQKTPEREEHDITTRLQTENPPSELSHKRCRDELTGNKDHPHMSFNNNGGFNGVSLTLGLHQNGIGIPETYHINAARRLGLDSHGFEATNQRPFGTQILHGFRKSNH